MNNRWIDFCYFVFPMNTPTISSAAVNCLASIWLLHGSCIFLCASTGFYIAHRHPKDVLFFYIHLILSRFIHRAITYNRCILYISLLFLSAGITSSVCVIAIRFPFSLLLPGLFFFFFFFFLCDELPRIVSQLEMAPDIVGRLYIIVFFVPRIIPSHFPRIWTSRVVYCGHEKRSWGL